VLTPAPGRDAEYEAAAREIDPDKRILAMLQPDHTVVAATWQQRRVRLRELQLLQLREW